MYVRGAFVYNWIKNWRDRRKGWFLVGHAVDIERERPSGNAHWDRLQRPDAPMLVERFCG